MATIEKVKTAEKTRIIKKTVDTTIGPVTETVKNGDHLPARFPVQWSAATTKRCHFPEFSTSPQQDVRYDDQRISIREEIDERGQPWNQILRANIHPGKVTKVPSEGASEKDVKEWLYYVLTQSLNADFVDNHAGVVGATLMKWKGNGSAFRKASRQMRFIRIFRSQTWCSKSYINVDGDVIKPSAYERFTIDNMLNVELKTLMKVEREKTKADKQKAKNEAKKETERSEKARRSLVRRMFCLGDSADETKSGLLAECEGETISLTNESEKSE